MRRYATACRFGATAAYEDGASSNFIFDDDEDARLVWRYPDLTAQVLYIGRVIAHTIGTQMAGEARMLATFQHAQELLKEVLEMPDQDASHVIRAVKENGWRVSGKLKAQYPALENEDTARRVAQAVRSAFEG
jgi:hypothetical protein